jgi:hypothetical protein
MNIEIIDIDHIYLPVDVQCRMFGVQSSLLILRNRPGEDRRRHLLRINPLLQPWRDLFARPDRLHRLPFAHHRRLAAVDKNFRSQ